MTYQKVTDYPTILHMPMTNGKFRLEGDTSKTATEVALFQFQQGHWEITGYHSKKLPQAGQNYGITELELTGLVCNIWSFYQLLEHQHLKVLVAYKSTKGKERANNKLIKNLTVEMAKLHLQFKTLMRKMYVCMCHSRLQIKAKKFYMIPTNVLKHLNMEHIHHNYEHLVYTLHKNRAKQAQMITKPKKRKTIKTQNLCKISNYKNNQAQKTACILQMKNTKHN